ncbi:MAG TPA: ABC transporter permease [Chitinophagaceae bacterium]|nr:ABC transporter permease [Chitinophagaceae bacterium]
MLRNYLTIALRNLRKYRFTSFINIFGLTVGLTCCLLILTYVINELSYDRFNPGADQIYRVNRVFNNADGAVNLTLSTVAPPFGPLLQHEFPDIQEYTRLLSNGKSTAIKYKEKLFVEKDAYFADERVFDFFPVRVVSGSVKTSLLEPNTVMLTPAAAKRYFGDENPMDKLIRVDNQIPCKVTGIYEPFPSNSHIHPDMMISFNTLRDTSIYGEKQLETNFGNNSFFTYLKFPKNYPVASIESRFPKFIDKVMPIPSGPNVTLPPGFKQSKFTSLYLQKLTDIHLYSHTDYEAEPNGDIKRVRIFSIIAIFILVIACINYMNLSSARSVLRAREIGVRKVVGARRKEIIAQFLSESVLITWLALLLAFLLTWLLIPYLNKLSGQTLSVNMLLNAKILIPLFFLPFAVGIISGIYPALFMSSFKPVKVLKGLVKTGGGTISFRQVLVVLQFGISIVLIIATTIVFQQLHYMQQAALGYNKDHIITLPYTSQLDGKFEAFRNTLLSNPNIKNAARSSRIPTGRLLDSQGATTFSGDSAQPVSGTLKMVATDVDFIPTYGIPMVAGRNFSRQYATDSNNYIINEAAVAMLGWGSADKAIGKDIRYGGTKGKIVGVVKDFHFESMHEQIIPLIFFMQPPGQNGYYGALTVKLSGGNVTATIQDIEKKWHSFLPETPFQYTFLDDNYEKLYATETQQGKLFTVFACIAILVACLGLFGLSAFIITQRIKEIGIRKVLGASTTEIVRVLSVDFLKLVFFAAVAAIPVAAYYMYSWLKDFAYHISMAWWVFLAAGVLAAAIALLTISFQAIKAAMANPVKSLRTE